MTNSEKLGLAILSVAADWSNAAIDNDALLEIVDYLAPLRHEELLDELGEEAPF